MVEKKETELDAKAKSKASSKSVYIDMQLLSEEQLSSIRRPFLAIKYCKKVTESIPHQLRGSTISNEYVEECLQKDEIDLNQISLQK